MPLSTWNELLPRLAEVPRENGTAALHQAANFILERLEASGVDVELVAFTATPWALRLAGVIALAAGLLYFKMMRSGRYGAAIAVTLAIPAILLAELEFHQPVFGWIGAQTQHHVLATLPARAPLQRLIFTAHYDTKTDLFDHIERAPVDFLGPPVVVLMLAGAVAGMAFRRRKRRWLRVLVTVCAWSGAIYGSFFFLALSSGALIPNRSPGALDDGGACAVLVRLAEELAAAPPLERTDVEVLLLSAEEVGVQGSWMYATDRFEIGRAHV